MFLEKILAVKTSYKQRTVCHLKYISIPIYVALFIVYLFILFSYLFIFFTAAYLIFQYKPSTQKPQMKC